MDRIFDYTPTATLPVLRRVCRQWRQRFDAEFYHLRDFAAWRHDVKTVQREGSLTLTCQHYRFATKDRTVETLSPWWIDWLPHCQVVDLCNDRFDFKSRDCILVDTLRVPYPHTSCQTEMPTLSCFDCRRVVFDNNFRIETTRDIEKLVINYRGKDFLPYALGISAGRSFKVSEVVFIAHSTEDNSAGQTVEECVDSLLDVCNRLQLGAHWAYVAPEAPPSWLTSNLNLDYRTIDEYRATIGERDFAIETDFDTPLRP